MFKRFVCILGMIGSVSACGGESAGGAISERELLSYTPSFATADTDTIASNASSSGASGIVAFSDVLSGATSLGSLKVRLSDDKTTAYMSVNGRSESALDLSSVSGTFHSYNTGSEYLIINVDDSTVQAVNYGKNTNNTMGSIGLETPEANLPTTGIVRYSGLYGGHAHEPVTPAGSENLVGTVYMDVNFTSDEVTGAFGIEPLTSTETGDLVGIIDGTVRGNGMSGDVTLTGGSYSGTITFAGKHMGHTGNEIFGAAAGSATINSDGSDRNIAVSFDMDMD